MWNSGVEDLREFEKLSPGALAVRQLPKVLYLERVREPEPEKRSEPEKEEPRRQIGERVQVLDVSHFD
jgi:hypothetical protein